jgi:G3E family GTPase
MTENKGNTTVVSAIPIILIAGYLGSGKTTFLNRLLSEAQGQRLAILVNDFGAINIDANLIDGAVDGVIALQNGCICCSIASGLQGAIFKVLKREQRPDAIIIEASGASNPGEVLRILSDSAMQDYAALEIVVTLLDCERLPTYTPEELKLIKLQLAYSNIVFLSKSLSLSGDAQVAAEGFVSSVNPRVLLFYELSSQINLEFLLGASTRTLGQQGNSLISDGLQMQVPKAEELFRSWIYESASPTTEAEFQKLLNELPSETVRGKGFLYLKEYPDSKFVFQLVGKNAKVEPAGNWGMQMPHSKIVFIALQNSNAPTIVEANN